MTLFGYGLIKTQIHWGLHIKSDEEHGVSKERVKDLVGLLLHSGALSCIMCCHGNNKGTQERNTMKHWKCSVLVLPKSMALFYLIIVIIVLC